MLNKYGVDATRLAILANVAPKSDRHWSLESKALNSGFENSLHVMVAALLFFSLYWH
jgi:leucyl-tRNA synthetase